MSNSGALTLCCQPCGESEAVRRSRMIDKEIYKVRVQKKPVIKIVILGTGESGKSTLFKQLSIIQDGGEFSIEQRMAYAGTVYRNIIDDMKTIVRAGRRLRVKMPKKQKELRQRIIETKADIDREDEIVFTHEMADEYKSILQNTAVQAMMQKHRDLQFTLNQNADYFFARMHEVADDDYVPSVEDVLRCRKATRTITEKDYMFDGHTFRMVDVGGQRCERKKWLHCFSDVAAVLFCVSLSEYNQSLREDVERNRTDEALLLFDEIVNYRHFRRTTIILFLNKRDVFEEKILKYNPRDYCFPEYTGGTSYTRALEYFEKQFQARNRKHDTVFVHVTSAVSTDNIRFVFKSIKQKVLFTLLQQTFNEGPM